MTLAYELEWGVDQPDSIAIEELGGAVLHLVQDSEALPVSPDYLGITEADLSDEEIAATGSLDSLKLFMDQNCDHPILTKDQEESLAKRIEDGDQAAFEEFCRCNIKLLVSIANHPRFKGKGVPLLDRIMYGYPGLHRAVEKFDYRQGTKFSTYATWWIRQAIQRGIAEARGIGPYDFERNMTLRKKAREFFYKHEREATPDELAKLLGWEFEVVEQVMKAQDPGVSLNMNVSGSDEIELQDLFGDSQGVEPEAVAVAGSLPGEVRRILMQLPDRHREVIERRYGLNGYDQPMSRPETAAAMGVGEHLVDKLEKQALAALATSSSLAEYRDGEPKDQPSVEYLLKGRKTPIVLSADEAKLTKWVKQGVTHEHMAEMMGVSEREAGRRTHNLFRKLGTTDKKAFIKKTAGMQKVVAAG